MPHPCRSHRIAAVSDEAGTTLTPHVQLVFAAAQHHAAQRTDIAVVASPGNGHVAEIGKQIVCRIQIDPREADTGPKSTHAMHPRQSGAAARAADP